MYVLDHDVQVPWLPLMVCHTKISPRKEKQSNIWSNILWFEYLFSVFINWKFGYKKFTRFLFHYTTDDIWCVTFGTVIEFNEQIGEDPTNMTKEKNLQESNINLNNLFKKR